MFEKNREENIARLESLNERLANASKEIESYADRDPERLQKMQDGIKVCKEAVERWTGDITF